MNKQLLRSLCFFATLLIGTNAFAAVDWVGNMFPASGSSNAIVEGEAFTIYIQAFKSGVTEPAGQGAGITCEVYYGEVSAFGQPWMSVNTMSMNYNIDIGNNDEYVGMIAPGAGTYEFTCRCSDDGGSSWTFASLPSGNGQLTVNAPLPVELISWDALVQQDAVALHWTTASEFNSSHFEVQRSSDLADWTTIARLDAKGTTKITQHYQLSDPQPLQGTSYYRLLQVDFDGSSDLSEIVAIEFQAPGQWLRAYPNPVRERLRVDIANNAPRGILSLQLYDTTGRLLQSQQTTAQEAIEIALDKHPVGLYLLRLIDSNGQWLAQQRIIKQ